MTMLGLVIKGSVPLPTASRTDTKVMRYLASLMHSRASHHPMNMAGMHSGSLYLDNPGIIVRATVSLPRKCIPMSKYPNAKERAQELESLMAALAFIQIAELDLDERPPILPTQCSHYLIAADAYLLVVPVSPVNEYDHAVIEEIMCLSKCDALIVHVSRSGNAPSRVVVDIGIDGLVPVWYREYRPCRLDGVLYFVPDHDASKPAFKLTKTGIKRSIDFDALQQDEL